MRFLYIYRYNANILETNMQNKNKFLLNAVLICCLPMLLLTAPLEGNKEFFNRRSGQQSPRINPLREGQNLTYQLTYFEYYTDDLVCTNNLTIKNNKISNDCKKRINQGVGIGLAGLSFCGLSYFISYWLKK